MSEALPPALDIPWTRKPLSSAKTEVSVLPDGRIKLWIDHEVITGVTPAMIVWWFKHLEGEIDFAGLRAERYRVWHPLDHIALRYAKRCADGSIGPGAVIHIQEMFARNPKWPVDVLTRIEKLDETGFIHCPHKARIKVAHAEYEFRAVDGGTHYTNWLIAGITGPLARVVNPVIRRAMFPDDRAVAWLTHNIEEVGNFESFLPALYELQRSK